MICGKWIAIKHRPLQSPLQLTRKVLNNPPLLLLEGNTPDHIFGSRFGDSFRVTMGKVNKKAQGLTAVSAQVMDQRSLEWNIWENNRDCILFPHLPNARDIPKVIKHFCLTPQVAIFKLDFLPQVTKSPAESLEHEVSCFSFLVMVPFYKCCILWHPKVWQSMPRLGGKGNVFWNSWTTCTLARGRVSKWFGDAYVFFAKQN